MSDTALGTIARELVLIRKALVALLEFRHTNDLKKQAVLMTELRAEIQGSEAIERAARGIRSSRP